MDYATKMNAMGIDERSLAGDVNPVADHVAAMGRGKMCLIRGAPTSSLKGGASKRMTGAAVCTSFK